MTTIAAISSAVGRAGIGIVRMSGPQSLPILKSAFQEDKEFKNRKMTYGHISQEGRIVDEVLAVYMEAPHTYTREDIVEIYTHGGMVAVRQVLEVLLDKGARLADPGEFTKRAFLNGRLDLAQAEAVIDIIDAQTSLSHNASISQLQGKLSEQVDQIRQELLNILASSITEIDFPEDENDTLSDQAKIESMEGILDQLEVLLENSKRGKLIKDGIKTLILGRPNVGKSSLLNVLLRENRAIVTDIPGTTRDTIEEIMDLDGLPIKLIDTAGIRETQDQVEKIGVDLAKSHIEDSDLILLVLDSTAGITAEDRQLLELTKDKNRIIVLNKIDLGSKGQIEDKEDYIEISALTGKGINQLSNKIKELFFTDQIDFSQSAYISNTRQLSHVKNAKKAVQSAIEDLQNGIPLDLVEVDINIAIDELAKITGDKAGEDILDQIFSEFCIGK